MTNNSFLCIILLVCLTNAQLRSLQVTQTTQTTSKEDSEEAQSTQSEGAQPAGAQSGGAQPAQPQSPPQGPLNVFTVLPDFKTDDDYLDVQSTSDVNDVAFQTRKADAFNSIFWTDKALKLNIGGVSLNAASAKDFSNYKPQEMQSLVEQLVFDPTILGNLGQPYNFTGLNVTWKLAAFGKLSKDLTPQIEKDHLLQKLNVAFESAPVQGYGCSVVKALMKMNKTFNTDSSLDSQVTALMLNATIRAIIEQNTDAPQNAYDDKRLPTRRSLQEQGEEQEEESEGQEESEEQEEQEESEESEEQEDQRPPFSDDTQFNDFHLQLHDLIKMVQRLDKHAQVVKNQADVLNMQNTLFANKIQDGISLTLNKDSLLDAITDGQNLKGQYFFILNYNFGVDSGYYVFMLRENYVFAEANLLRIQPVNPQDLTVMTLGVSSTLVNLNLQYGLVSEFISNKPTKNVQLTPAAPSIQGGFSLIQGTDLAFVIVSQVAPGVYSYDVDVFVITNSDPFAADCMNSLKQQNPLSRYSPDMPAEQKQILEKSLLNSLQDQRNNRKQNAQPFDPKQNNTITQDFCGINGDCNLNGQCIQDEYNHGRCSCNATFLPPHCLSQQDSDNQQLYLQAQINLLSVNTRILQDNGGQAENLQNNVDQPEIIAKVALNLQATLAHSSPTNETIQLLNTALKNLLLPATDRQLQQQQDGNVPQDICSRPQEQLVQQPQHAENIIDLMSEIHINVQSAQDQYTPEQLQAQKDDIHELNKNSGQMHVNCQIDGQTPYAQLSGDSQSIAAARVSSLQPQPNQQQNRILAEDTTYYTFQGEPVLNLGVTISASSVVVPSAHVVATGSKHVQIIVQSDGVWSHLMTEDAPPQELTSTLATLITQLIFQDNGQDFDIIDEVNLIQITLGLKDQISKDGTEVFQGVMIDSTGIVSTDGVTVLSSNANSVTISVKQNGNYAAKIIPYVAPESKNSNEKDLEDNSYVLTVFVAGLIALVI